MNTVGQLRDDVAGMMSGTNVDKVTGLYKAFERAARKLAQKADVPEAAKKDSITLYDGVYEYFVSEMIFGSSVLDIRPQGVSRTYFDSIVKRPIELFDRTKIYAGSGIEFAFEWDNGNPVLRIAGGTSAKSGVTLDNMSDTNGWNLLDSASDLAKDETAYYQLPASLRFSLNGDDVGALRKTLPNRIDMSAYKKVGVAFLAARIPDGAENIIYITLRIGSSASDYEEVTKTSGFLGDWNMSANKWILVDFDFSQSSATGTPDWSAIQHIDIIIRHTTSFTNVRVGKLFMSLPSPHEIIYQTAAFFERNGARSATITDDDDRIILNNAAYILYEHECALQVALQERAYKTAQQLRAALYGGEGDLGLYAQYRADNPSQEIRSVGNYLD